MSTLNLTTDGDSGIFYTIQGEGLYTGVPSVFVRLSSCNLRCSWKNQDGSLTRCDSPNSSFDAEKNLRVLDEIVSDIHNYRCHHVVVTGGEPFFQKNSVELIDKLVDLGHHVTVETNGTIYRETRAQFISLSPKLKSSAAEKYSSGRLNVPALYKFIKNPHVGFQLKFVASAIEDIKEIKGLIEDLRRCYVVNNVNHGLVEPAMFGTLLNRHTWLMPQGITTQQFDEKAEWIVEQCKENGWRFCDRLHVRIWGHKRGT